MSNQLAEGFWPCTVISGEVGQVADKPGIVKARINVKIDDGPSKGRTCTYEDEINNKSAVYVSRSMTAVGWKGKSLATFAADVDTWTKSTGGMTTVEIKHIPIKNGKRAGEIWDKPNSIGRGPRPLAKPQGEALSDADEALQRALADDGFSSPSEPINADDAPF